MADERDFDLEKEPTIAPAPAYRPHALLPWVAGALVAVAAGAAFFYFSGYFSGDGTDVQTADTPAPVTAEAPPPGPLGPEVEPIELPPLDQSDMLVRKMVRSLSLHPTIAAWLTTDGLIRNFVVVVENIVGGHTPSGHLRQLAPAERFAVMDTDGSPVIDQRSYARYNAIASAAASVDPDGAAILYSTLKPRIEEAWSEVGIGPFDRALETAIVRLLEVPVVEGDVALVPKGGIYGYDDARLERLTSAQKQLLRMGPRNVRTIQGALRNIAFSLGIPAGRLPPR